LLWCSRMVSILTASLNNYPDTRHGCLNVSSCYTVRMTLLCTLLPRHCSCFGNFLCVEIADSCTSAPRPSNCVTCPPVILRAHFSFRPLELCYWCRGSLAGWTTLEVRISPSPCCLSLSIHRLTSRPLFSASSEIRCTLSSEWVGCDENGELAFCGDRIWDHPLLFNSEEG
jgi:hypothetical protein